MRTKAGGFSARWPRRRGARGAGCTVFALPSGSTTVVCAGRHAASALPAATSAAIPQQFWSLPSVNGAPPFRPAAGRRLCCEKVSPPRVYSRDMGRGNSREGGGCC